MNIKIDHNIIKNICAELNINHSELAEILQVSKTSIDRWASTGLIPKKSEKLILLFMENLRLKKELVEIRGAMGVFQRYCCSHGEHFSEETSFNS